MQRDEPWLTEPNEATFDASGYPCVLRRGLSGVWCGYVGVFEGHPWFGLHCSDRVTSLHDTIAETYGAFDLLIELTRPDRPDGQLRLALAVHVHGCVTLAMKASEFTDNPAFVPEAWYFGFDCGHSGDIAPGLAEPYRSTLARLDPDAVYRTVDYATGEVLRLAAQLRLVEKRGTR
jgi:hypothetical protein